MLTNQNTTTNVLDAAEAVLTAYTRRSGPGDGPFEDPGVLVLAAMWAQAAGSGAPRPMPDAATAWVGRCRGGAGHLGVSGGGMAGFVLGLREASTAWPELAPTAARMRTRLVDAAARRPWRRAEVGWEDYDLIQGPSGTLAVLASDPAGTPEDCAPLIEHLVELSGGDLSGLRVGQYQGEPLRGFNTGRINVGVGHGVPGVVIGLRTAADAGVLPAAGFDALGRLADWLVGQSFVDARGVRSWPSAGLDNDDTEIRARLTRHASRRQAWCYGNPGVAWTIWEAGRVLADPELMAFALDAAGSFLAAYDGSYLDDDYPDQVGICHGAAGLLLIFDAFARYAQLSGAAQLRDHLADFLQERLEQRLDDLVQGSPSDLSLLAGAAGAVATLLTCLRDGGRGWMAAFGLR